MRLQSIVLVDDDKDDHEIFKSAWAVVDRSIDILWFDNGEKALQALSQMNNPPDIIFLDLNMPRFNGIEVLEVLKTTTKLSSIPVIIYTTSFDSKVRDECFNLGAAEIMEKPSDFNSLCEKLESVLHALA
jgi:CheY-like chemotaxis protein